MRKPQDIRIIDGVEVKQCVPQKKINTTTKTFCFEWKPVGNFYKRSDNNNYRSQCIKCYNYDIWAPTSQKNHPEIKIINNIEHKQCIPRIKKNKITKIEISYCKEWKPLSEFQPRGNGQYRGMCNLCRKLYTKEFDRIRLLKPEVSQRRKQYAIDNKESINKAQRDRRKNDPVYAARRDASREVGKKLQQFGSSKQGKSTKNHFPWTDEELKADFEAKFLLPENLGPDGKPWMTWQNRGRYNPKTYDPNDASTWTWQMDHIIPHSEFHYETMDCKEFEECWGLTNLRPLNSKQNILDGTHRTRHKKGSK